MSGSGLFGGGRRRRPVTPTPAEDTLDDEEEARRRARDLAARNATLRQRRQTGSFDANRLVASRLLGGGTATPSATGLLTGS